MSKKLKIIIAVVAVVVVGLSVFFGCYYGIKLAVVLDYGYSTGDRILGYEEKIVYERVIRGSYYSPPRPSRASYKFKGWYKDSACTVPWVNGVDRVKSDITLYAKWEAN